MAHRRRRAAAGHPVVFELVVADEAPERAGPREPSSVPGAATDADRAADRTWHAWRLGVPVGLVGLVGAVLLVGGIVDAGRDEGRLGQATAALAPLPAEPAPTWTVDVALDGVVERWGALVTLHEGTAVARDVATGEERWSARVGDGADCGQVDGRAPATPGTDPLVCVAGAGGERTVVVLDRDGEEVARRDLTVGGGSVEPGADGTVLVARRTGEPVDARALLPYGWTADEQVEVPGGRGADVVAQDAVTGEERWRTRLAFLAPANIWECVGFSDDTAVVDVDRLEVSTVGGLVHVDGCGVGADLTSAGVRLDVPGSPDAVVPLEDGTYLRTAPGDGTGSGPVRGRGGTGAGGDVVLDGSGEQVWRAPGSLLVPGASDGSSARTRLVRTQDGLAAFGTDGAERWRDLQDADRVLVQTVDTAVLLEGGDVTAVDLATGERRWEHEVDDGWQVESAFTDGDRAVLWTTSAGNLEGERSRVTAYDLGDGDRAWRVGSSRIRESVVAVDGSLLRVTDDGVARLG
ncbi:PQQ-binding-like beta-propeller repeat protein [Cellulomonas sp. PhB143]|uniref:outer membrane protein assembly factor BamB family protein n=1 Tax=Cellulomonas sp. PhB143 TaxID=2485186 RepID=UPI000F4A01A8|nr:PQQ-binding-like beta-propeller repeat protein [Cellulomonas sp. PhB143]ROS75370.1 putative pyrroloquinoline-quinone binding quinoprotein [Cellulomonas sp. PhB143]